MAKKFVVIARKWFDKVNGNTYHSVVVVDANTNKRIVEVPFRYGYGDQWKHTAYDELIKKGYVKEKDRFNHELNRKRFIYTVTDVQRKKDLLEGVI
jgi:hypothetical protein